MTFKITKAMTDDMARITASSMNADREEKYEAALERIHKWAEAYPLDIFPEPDLKRAHEILKAHGMGVDGISAEAMRHALKGVGRIAKEALSE